MIQGDLTTRATIRGLKKCPYCCRFNGNRAKGCANEKCPLYINKAAKSTQIDAVKLVSKVDKKVYSVRTKDRANQALQRSFVQITDSITADQAGAIVSRNAICYVDTCKYDSNDMNLSCKHVKSACETTRNAEEIKISKDILYSLNINNSLKDSLWILYDENESIVPAVQKINKSTFVVKCTQNATFPAGLLHISISEDGEAESVCLCACKKLRISMSPNDSIVLENDVCDHLLLLLSGIMSSKIMKASYQKVLNSFNSLWVTENLVNIFSTSLLPNEDFASFSENILSSCVQFDETNQLNDTNLSILEGDPNITKPANFIEKDGIELISVNIDNNQFEDENLELSECQIELMDQFKLTNQIDLCNDEIHLCGPELFDENNVICDFQDTAPPLEQETAEAASDKADHSAKYQQKKSETLSKRKLVIEIHDADALNNSSPPTLEFNEWFEFALEQMNSALDIHVVDSTICHRFHIKNDFFNYLSRRFSIGDKRRLPNSTTVIKSGKYKGLVKSTWIFTTLAAVNRIFSTKKISLATEKIYTEKGPGKFIEYNFDEFNDVTKSSKKFKPILPTLYKVFIPIGTKNQITKAFKIEWTGNVFPKSKFGELVFEHPIGYKRNNQILEKSPLDVR